MLTSISRLYFLFPNHLRAKRQSPENDTILDDVLSTLKADIRYRALEPSQSKAMLEEFLQRLSE